MIAEKESKTPHKELFLTFPPNHLACACLNNTLAGLNCNDKFGFVFVFVFVFVNRTTPTVG